MKTKSKLVVMSPMHPRWNEFLDELEGPYGCHYRLQNGKFTYDCLGGMAKPSARRILKAMGFTTEATDASLAYFEEQGGYCDCEILLNMVYVDEVDLVIDQKRDPRTRRQMFKHLSDDGLAEIINWFGEDPSFYAWVFSVAYMQRDAWNEEGPCEPHPPRLRVQ